MPGGGDRTGSVDVRRSNWISGVSRDDAHLSRFGHGWNGPHWAIATPFFFVLCDKTFLSWFQSGDMIVVCEGFRSIHASLKRPRCEI